MAGQIGRHYFEAGLGEMYMVPEKQKYLKAESSILATIAEEPRVQPLSGESRLAGAGASGVHSTSFAKTVLSVTQQLSL